MPLEFSALSALQDLPVAQEALVTQESPEYRDFRVTRELLERLDLREHQAKVSVKAFRPKLFPNELYLQPPALSRGSYNFKCKPILYTSQVSLESQVTLELPDHRERRDQPDLRESRERMEHQDFQDLEDRLVIREMSDQLPLLERMVLLVLLDRKDLLDQLDLEDPLERMALLELKAIKELLEKRDLLEMQDRSDLQDQLDLREILVQLHCRESQVSLKRLYAFSLD